MARLLLPAGAMGGWLALPAVLLLGPRSNPYRKDGAISAHPPSNIPFFALGAWILTVGWFGFNVMSAQTIDRISGLVAVNSLMAMAGGTLAALALGRNATTCWACGHCTACAAPGAASSPASSASRRLAGSAT